MSSAGTLQTMAASKLVDVASGRYRQMDTPACPFGLLIKAGMGKRMVIERQKVTHRHDYFLPNRIASAGQTSRQSPQFVQFASPGLVPISQTLRHSLQPLHSGVL